MDPRHGHDHGDGIDEEESLASLPPKQCLNERREIRQQYRRLNENIKEHTYDLVDPGNNELQTKLTEASGIFSKVKMTREAAMDSSTLVLISQLGKQKAQKLTTDFLVFQPTDFADKLVMFLTGERQESLANTRISKKGWESLGQAFLPLVCRSPALHFMYGAFEAGEPKVKVKPKKERIKDKDKNVAEQKPKTISNTANMSQMEQTTAEVEKVQDKLREISSKYQGPICLIEFVTNPYSFGQTVENIFYVSFLVRDGHVRVYLDDDRLPVIEPVSEDVARSRDLPNMEKTVQVVLNITEEDWRSMIKEFGITEPVIPTRERLDSENEENIEDVEPSTSKPPKHKQKMVNGKKR